MNTLLAQLARAGDIGWLSYHFAGFIAQQAGIEAEHALVYTAALVCEANRNGDVCIDLMERSGQPYFTSDQIETARIPRAEACETWRLQILDSRCVGTAGESAPLTLDGNRLYLNRFWHYESSVAAGILDRASWQEDELPTPLATIAEGLDPDQQAAIQTAARRRFCVISGGPGSGKTATVTRLLALLLSKDPHTRIALAAPTGKAAARMMDSIRQSLAHEDIDERLHPALPEEASTIHRLLDYKRQAFGYHRQHRLPVDCVVIDEASMLDLKLLFHLIEALPDHARLILLGDRDQLASVAAGYVLGDITGHGIRQDDNPITDSIALLNQSYRFTRDSAVGELATLVNQGMAGDTISLLQRQPPGLIWYDNDSDQIDPRALTKILDRCQALRDSKTPQQALEAFATTRLLCATNRGGLGVDTLNQLISSALLNGRQQSVGDLYHGLPIMVVRNQHELGLFNGDTGILWQGDHGLQACFDVGSGEVRRLALNRLPEFVPAWASTVHKSQGSEYDSVVLVLPADAESPLLVRELIYTAITRARKSFCLHGSSDALRRAIDNLTRRHSGLAEKLGWSGPVT